MCMQPESIIKKVVKKKVKSKVRQLRGWSDMDTDDDDDYDGQLVRLSVVIKKQKKNR